MRIIECDKLPKMDMFGLSDPFVLVCLVNPHPPSSRPQGFFPDSWY